MSLKRWLILLACGVSATLTLIAAGNCFLSLEKLKKIEAQAWEEYVQASARQIQARGQELSAWVEGLSRDPHLVDALASGGEVKTEEQRLTRIIPAAVQVQILPGPVDRWQEAHSLGLGFADLDLVHQAETGEPPPAVHSFGARSGYVAVARAIKREDRVIGVILVRVGLDWLQSLLPTPSTGALALSQGSLQLAYRGELALQSRPPTGTVSIAHTLWQIQYWTPFSAWADWVSNVAILALALLAVAVMFWLVWRKYARAIDRDRTALFVLVNDLIAGTVRGNYSLALQELAPLLDRLLRVQRLEAHSRPVPPPGKPEALTEVELQAIPDSSLEKAPPEETRAKVPVPKAIFRSDAICGKTTEVLTPTIAYELGRALGSEAGALGEQSIVVGSDARDLSGELSRALVEGLRASGRDVIDLGKVPVPLVYFAIHSLPVRSGVMVTGGHHGPQYNGLKIVIAQQPWYGEQLQRLQQRLKAGDFSAGMGMVENRDLLADYIGAVIDDVQIARPLKVIVDCGAGVAIQVVPALLRTLGLRIEESHSYDMLDPFAPRALDRLCAKVQKDPEAELGLAFDGDGDRLAVVDASGNLILPDQVLMVLAADVLSREPGGDIVFDVECSRQLAGYIVQHGGRPVVAPSGHGHIRAKMSEVGAMLGGGFSGYLVFQERWFGLADAIYGAARLLEVLSSEPAASDEVFASLPKTVATPQLRVALARDEADGIIRVLVASADKFFRDAKINPLDGVRVDFADGWGLVRASRAVPALVFRFEADDEPALARIQARFREWFKTLEITLDLPFDGSGE